MRGYTPPAAVVQLANDDTMNAYTRHLFYLNRPRLLSNVTAFRSYCPEDKRTIVLGCYHPGQNGIFIYAVHDASLAGIQQVTAAHEVLHAVYARLSGSARARLDSELQAFYAHGLTNTNVKAEVALYKQTEPNSVYDEMSCTFGTELTQLPPDLTAYYAQYFSNRQKIVGYESQYRAQFVTKQQQIDSYDAQLSGMKQQIDEQQASLTAESVSLNEQKTQLQRLSTAQQISAYDAVAASYNRLVDTYNAGIAQLQQRVAAYNQLVSVRNGIAGQLTTLDSAIDTRVPSKLSP